jgi:hypothetical protein
MLKEGRLKDMNSFYFHDMNDTWHNNFTNTNYAHDRFLIRQVGKKIMGTDVYVCKSGCQSDHLPIRLDVRVKSGRKKSDRIRPNWKTTTKPKPKVNSALLKRGAHHIKFQQKVASSIART